ncbi:MAG: DUF1501 domain-containing protein, partial [Pseudoxanthomonas sp.]
DHWSMAQSILFAGGGTKPGRIIGATDNQAAAPTELPISIKAPPIRPSGTFPRKREKGSIESNIAVSDVKRTSLLKPAYLVRHRMKLLPRLRERKGCVAAR